MRATTRELAWKDLEGRKVFYMDKNGAHRIGQVKKILTRIKMSVGQYDPYTKRYSLRHRISRECVFGWLRGRNTCEAISDGSGPNWSRIRKQKPKHRVRVVYRGKIGVVRRH